MNEFVFIYSFNIFIPSSTLQVKMSPTASQGDFGDVLTSTATSDPSVPVEKRPEATPIATQEEQPH
jgi:hypothetical protein